MPVVFWSSVKMHRNHVRCSANGYERRSGQAERYDGCKDGSPDAHDSSKATPGPATVSARCCQPSWRFNGHIGVFCPSGGSLRYHLKGIVLSRYYRANLPGRFLR